MQDLQGIITETATDVAAAMGYFIFVGELDDFHDNLNESGGLVSAVLSIDSTETAGIYIAAVKTFNKDTGATDEESWLIKTSEFDARMLKFAEANKAA